MKRFLIIMGSAIFLALFVFKDLYSLPLTRSSYTLSGEMTDIAVREEIIRINDFSRRETFSFNLGIPSNSSIGFDFSLLHDSLFDRGGSVSGDTLFNFWHFTGTYFNDFLDSGINITVRIPTGPDAFSEKRYRNLSFGNNELKVMPVFGLKFTAKDVLFINISYTFREAHGESLYDGFKFNPGEKDTYRSVLGLNPFFKGAFLYRDNLKNDYCSVAAGFVTSRFSPFILFSEFYYSSRIYKGDIPSDDIDIEGAGVNPMMVSAGVKYLFSESFIIQGSIIKNIIMKEHYINNIAEMSLNILF